MARKAEFNDIPQINRVRRQVSEIHAQARPDIFRPGFNQDLQDQVLLYLEAEDRDVFVEERDGQIVGIASVEYLDKPESPYGLARKDFHVVEFGVDEAWRRKGVGHALMEHLREEAAKGGFGRIILDVWDFNDALLFYEAEGFTEFRHFMEFKLPVSK